MTTDDIKAFLDRLDTNTFITVCGYLFITSLVSAPLRATIYSYTDALLSKVLPKAPAAPSAAEIAAEVHKLTKQQ